MGMGKTQDESLPWGPQGKEYKKLYAEADDLLTRTLNYYPDSTIAARNPWQTQANRNVATMVGEGSPGMTSALAENQRTTSGQYLDVGSNPYLRGVGDAAAEDTTRAYNRGVMPGIASRFGGAGRSAGPQDPGNAEGNAMSAARRDLGQELSQMYSGLYGGAYEAERGRMGQAVGMAPSMRGMQFADQAALQAAGRDEFQYAQMLLSDQVNRFNFEQYEPYERLGRFQGLINQPGGYGTSVGTSGIGGMQIAGMAASAAAPIGGSMIEGMMSS
jgi:hypothetical protein